MRSDKTLGGNARLQQNISQDTTGRQFKIFMTNPKIQTASTHDQHVQESTDLQSHDANLTNKKQKIIA